MAVFYILYSSHLDRFYLGHTTQPVEERLRKHLTNHKAWTARAKDWRIVHTEVYGTKASAYRRELEVKSWKRRDRIEQLIGAAR